MKVQRKKKQTFMAAQKNVPVIEGNAVQYLLNEQYQIHSGWEDSAPGSSPGCFSHPLMETVTIHTYVRYYQITIY